MSKGSSIQTRASQATRCLEEAWQMLRAIDSRIPAVVILVSDTGRGGKAAGHFAQSTWRYRADRNAHEVAINPGLFHLPESVLATLLHEAAHAASHAQRIVDCGKGGYYHRKEFRSMAESLGLECGFHNGRYGWSVTRLRPDGMSECLHTVADHLRRGLPLGTGDQIRTLWKTKTLPRSGQVRLACGCARERSVYTSRSVAAQGGLRCDLCGRRFLEKDAPPVAAELRTPREPAPLP